MVMRNDTISAIHNNESRRHRLPCRNVAGKASTLYANEPKAHEMMMAIMKMMETTRRNRKSSKVIWFRQPTNHPTVHPFMQRSPAYVRLQEYSRCRRQRRRVSISYADDDIVATCNIQNIYFMIHHQPCAIPHTHTFLSPPSGFGEFWNFIVENAWKRILQKNRFSPVSRIFRKKHDFVVSWLCRRSHVEAENLFSLQRVLCRCVVACSE